MSFIEINIESSVEQEANYELILTHIKKYFNKFGINDINLIDTEKNPKLRINFIDKNQFITFYKKDDAVLSRFMEFLQKGKFPQSFINTVQEKEINSLDSKNLYLVLKYKTDFKSPIRHYYNQIEWYRQFFKINISTEELTDGFLFFYQKKQDFHDALIDKSNPIEIINWIDSREYNINLKNILDFLKSV